MTEKKAEYNTEAQEAMDMLGKGYEHPSVEIAPAHTVIERRGSEFKEVVKPAFVKISTSFKAEMKTIDEIALKVWLYISLSVNRYSGRANPGLRTIARDCNLAVNTVRSAIERLENEYDLMVVDRESKRYNIYEPLAFVSANRSEPVSLDDTPAKTVSPDTESVSTKDESVSARVILNQSNQSNQKRGDLIDGMLEFEKQAQDKVRYPLRDKLPEPYLDYSDWYVNTTGQKPRKSVINDWMLTFDDWVSAGISIKDLDAAYKYATRPSGGFMVSRPGSLTNTAIALKSKPQEQESYGHAL